jgi:hypothetical protein
MNNLKDGTEPKNINFNFVNYSLYEVVTWYLIVELLLETLWNLYENLFLITV